MGKKAGWCLKRAAGKFLGFMFSLHNQEDLILKYDGFVLKVSGEILGPLKSCL